MQMIQIPEKSILIQRVSPIIQKIQSQFGCLEFLILTIIYIFFYLM